MKTKIRSLLLALAPFLTALLAIPAVQAAQLDLAGEIRCSTRQGHFRDGTKADAPYVYRLNFGKVENGRASTERSGRYPDGDPRGSYNETYVVTFEPNYAVHLRAEGSNTSGSRWRFALDGQGSAARSSLVLIGPNLGGKELAEEVRTCTFTAELRGGSLADAAVSGEQAQLARQRQDVDAERARLAAEQSSLDAERQKLEADKLRMAAQARNLDEERQRLAGEQANAAAEKKQAVEREKLAAADAKRHAEEASRRKSEQEREEANRARDADRVRLASAQQALQTQQNATEQRVGKVETVLGGIVLARGERTNDWIVRAPSIPVQQQQFCRIVDKFHDDIAAVYRTRNDIKKNSLYKDRQQDVAALMPNGNFENWLVRIVEVTQASDGSAAVMLQLPCRAMLGSDACAKDPAMPRATIAPSSPAFRELQRMDTGGFVVVSGRVLFAAADVGARALPTYATYQPGSHCAAAEGGRQQDVFTSEVRYLVQMR